MRTALALSPGACCGWSCLRTAQNERFGAGHIFGCYSSRASATTSPTVDHSRLRDRAVGEVARAEERERSRTLPSVLAKPGPGRAEALPPPSRRMKPRGRGEGVPPLSSQSEGRGRTGAGAKVARWPLRPLKEDTVTAPTPTGKGRREGVPPGLDCECNQLDRHAISGLHACRADCIHATKPGAGAVS